jgi:hypothetical protein
MENAVQDSSNVNAIGLLFLLAMSLVMWQGRRHAAVNALLATAAFLPLGQQIVVFGLHFQFFRIIVVVGFMRVLARGETTGFKLNSVDKLFGAWALVSAICGALREPDSIAGVHCLGGAFNSLGTYFLIRVLIKEPNELLRHIRFLAIAAVIVGLAISLEFITHRNLFAVFGGVPEVPSFRDGRFRCQGPFEHPILAGTFMATSFPLLVGLWIGGRRDRMLASLAIAACVFSSYAAASSGALMTCLVALVGLALWLMRTRMKLIRQGLVLLIIASALLMNAPVWYILARLGSGVGGTGWHRAYLIDQAVNHFGEWWLIGTAVTAHWAPAGQVLTVDPKNMDITNHYVMQGVMGGILGLGLFLAVIVCCFKVVGQLLRKKGLPLHPKLIWAFGVSLACHSTAMISISYFDQIQVFWFWLLAAFACLTAWSQKSAVSLRISELPQNATANRREVTPWRRESDILVGR